MAKKKYRPEKIIKIIQEYLQGKGSSYELAEKYDLSAKTIMSWVHKYRIHGYWIIVNIVDTKKDKI